MPRLIVLLVALLLLAGCVTTKNEKKSLNEWGQLSRPKF